MRPRNITVFSPARCALVLALLPMCAACQQGTQPAAAALGVLAGVGLGTDFFTRSSIKVDVDVFQDTLGIENPNQLATPFKMGDKAAFARNAPAKTEVVDPVKSPSQPDFVMVKDQCTPAFRDLKLTADQMRPMAAQVAAAKAAGGEWGEVATAFSERVESFDNLQAAWDRYVGIVSGLRSFETNAAILENAANALKSMRDAITPLEQNLPPIYLGFLSARMFGALNAADPSIGASYARGADAYRGPDGTEKLNYLLDQAREALNAGRSESARQTAMKGMEQVLQDFGVGIPVEQIVALKSLEETRHWVDTSADVALRQPRVAREMRRQTFATNRLVNFNEGPLVNEAMQQVLTKSAYIDTITNESNKRSWKRLNYAESSGGMGTHNAVIYLENWATPFLKSSDFDPTKFLVAHGALYRKAFGIVGQVMGIPQSGDAATTGTLKGLNIHETDARRKNADATLQKVKKSILGSLKAAIDEQAVTKKAEKRTDPAKPGVWADDTQKAAAIASAKARLTAQATALENP